MADYRRFDPKCGQHSRRDLSGVGSFSFPEHVLSGYRHRTPLGGLGRLQEACERWGYHHVAILHLPENCHQFAYESRSLSARLEHLPVADDKGGPSLCVVGHQAGSSSGRVTTPGNSAPSMYSMEAPPPIDT